MPLRDVKPLNAVQNCRYALDLLQPITMYSQLTPLQKDTVCNQQKQKLFCTQNSIKY